MTRISDDALDLAITKLQSGLSVAQVLEANPENGPAMAPLLATVVTLQALSPIEIPGQQALTDDRNEFLARITDIQLQPVSPGPFARLNSWILLNFPWLIPGSWGQRNEVRKMGVILLKAVLVMTVTFGSIGGVFAAAENSLPGSPVYSIKLIREQLRLALNSDPAHEAELHLNNAEERVWEIIQTAARGDVPQEATMNRLQSHMDEAYRNMAQAPDDSLLRLLVQAQEMTQVQEQTLIQAQEQVNQQSKDRLQETARLMAQWRKVAEDGLQEPEQFRLRYRGGQDGESPGPGQPGGNPDCSGDCEPIGDENKYGQDGGGPAQGPGPGEPGGNPDCDGDCEPSGDENKYGQDGEDPPQGPGPGEPGGNPDCDGDCEPAGDENKYGQDGGGPAQGPGPGEPSGNPDCEGDCEPAGDENKYGQDGEDPPQGPGPGEPGGNPDCDGDCEPAGDEKKYGQEGDGPDQSPGPGESGGNPEGPNDNDGSGGDGSGTTGSQSPGGPSGG